MRITDHIKKHNRGGLIGGLIYMSLGAISLAAYFMERKGIQIKFISQAKTLEKDVFQPKDSQERVNVLQN